ncbi:MAG: DUF58 domain-containing protein [Candidatus Cloacimonetes bacterium HGW-Cloacimonetes-3]|jgi:uncharacterized protein (DUF58 family)|nr:MAG: DUF58 domain-containing protein [Candidatus Cloacimonetes bacterium HGW-Cloacimonetes-3]
MPLLSEEELIRLNKFQLSAKSVVEGFLVGLHKSPYHGFSAEFSDHRQYNPGEPLKDMDWKVLAKTQRYYVKRYEEETNLRSYILLDHSKSMFYASGKSSKIEYAKRLTGALAWLMISQKDAAGLYTFNTKITSALPPKAIRSYTSQIFGRLMELQPEDKTDVLIPLHQIAELIRKRSLVVLISDLLDDPDKILSALKHFRARHHEVLVFHIVDPQEESFEFKRETEFVDSETGDKITVSPWQIRKEYLANIQSFTAYLKTECQKNQIEYNPVSTATPLEDLLLKYLIKRKRG